MSDQYPLVLIDGARLAHEVQSEMINKGLKLEELLDRETVWYRHNERALAADRVAFGDHWGHPVEASENDK